MNCLFLIYNSLPYFKSISLFFLNDVVFWRQCWCHCRFIVVFPRLMCFPIVCLFYIINWPVVPLLYRCHFTGYGLPLVAAVYSGNVVLIFCCLLSFLALMSFSFFQVILFIRFMCFLIMYHFYCIFVFPPWNRLSKNDRYSSLVLVLFLYFSIKCCRF